MRAFNVGGNDQPLFLLLHSTCTCVCVVSYFVQYKNQDVNETNRHNEGSKSVIFVVVEHSEQR